MESISPKVAVGAIVGAMVTVLIWCVKAVWKIEVPGEVGAALTTIFTGVASYLTPHAKPPISG